METRPDAHGLRRLRVVLVVECPRLAHDRVSGDPHIDFRDATLSRDCVNTLKIFRPTESADFVNRPPLSKPSPRRNRHHRSAALRRCRTVFDGYAHTISLSRFKYLGHAKQSEVVTQCQYDRPSVIQVFEHAEQSEVVTQRRHASTVQSQLVQPLEGSS